MGGSSSKQETRRQTSSSWNQYPYPPSPYSQQPQDSPSYSSRPTVPSYAPAQGQSPAPQRKLDRRYSKIADDYKSLEEVTDALARAGLESSNLIVGIDFTKSNEWTGKRSFSNRSLHHIGNTPNPYEQAISIIGKTLAAFDEDNLIPCFGFGDATTHDQDVFSFYPDERFCNGFEEVLSRYREIQPHLKLSGPTSFAPLIEMAMTIVEQSGGQYHVLVIIADGQVTRSVDTASGQLSPQERRSVESIVEASKFPLSIILVGVGDGPWDMMKEFDDNIPARDFDNFQFVNFTEIMSKNVAHSRKETEFALAALMEIPAQYKATMELGILGGQKGRSPGRVPLPPPMHQTGPVNHAKRSRETSFSRTPSSYYDAKPSREAAFPQSSISSPYYDYNSSSSYYDAKPSREAAFPQSSSSSPYYDYNSSSSSFEPAVSAPPSSTSTSTYDNQFCPVCLSNFKDMAFGCGHQTCCECGKELEQCPICRVPIQTRIKLY